MKKFKQIVAAWGAPAVALVLPALVSAQVSNPPVVAPQPYQNINQVTGASGILCIAINWIFWFLIVLTIIFVLVAAFKYLTAAGNPEKVTSASHTLLYAAIAVVVAVLARGLPYIIASFLGASFGQVC